MWIPPGACSRLWLLFLLIFVWLCGLHAQRPLPNLQGMTNTRLHERLGVIQRAAPPSRPTDAPKTLKKLKRTKAEDYILAGELDDVSLSDLKRFVDRSRAETRRLDAAPGTKHPRDCVCLDHIGFGLKRDLARLTVGDEEYGDTIFSRPSAWSPPVVPRAHAPEHQELVLFAFVTFTLVTFLAVCLFIFIGLRFMQARAAAAAAKADAEAQHLEEPAPEGFDISRVDIVS